MGTETVHAAAGRRPEECPHRGRTGDAKGRPVVDCRLAAVLAGAEAVPVGLDACEACCRGAVPSALHPGPVVASFVRPLAMIAGNRELEARMIAAIPVIKPDGAAAPAGQPPRPPCVHLGDLVRSGGGCLLCDVHECRLLGVDVTRRDDCATCPQYETEDAAAGTPTAPAPATGAVPGPEAAEADPDAGNEPVDGVEVVFRPDPRKMRKTPPGGGAVPAAPGIVPGIAPGAMPAPPPRRLILRTGLPPGDVVCLTAAVRDLHVRYPGRFVTDVRTLFPALWENNPHITPIRLDCDRFERHEQHDQPCLTDAIDDGGEPVEILDMHYPAVHTCNDRGVHLAEGWAEHLAAKLGLPHLRLSRLAGDVHLSRGELRLWSKPHEKHNVQRYWVIHANAKKDFTTKRWPAECWQEVVDRLRGRIQFVQVGVDPADDHWCETPRLRGVIDLVGKTNMRELVRTVHSSIGVLTGISLPMHLAAAVPLPDWQKRARPCVVVAGGREPRAWYGYPTHRILETVGQLSCCSHGGCWKSRTVKLHDGKDDQGGLCQRVVDGAPACMRLIEPADVVRAIEGYQKALGYEV